MPKTPPTPSQDGLGFHPQHPEWRNEEAQKNASKEGAMSIYVVVQDFTSTSAKPWRNGSNPSLRANDQDEFPRRRHLEPCISQIHVCPHLAHHHEGPLHALRQQERRQRCAPHSGKGVAEPSLAKRLLRWSRSRGSPAIPHSRYLAKLSHTRKGSPPTSPAARGP